jgi:16S rRNA (adenine1518-N6/adenine1519-N6)-dimethyltransferase
VAVEIDAELANSLRTRAQQDNVTVVTADVLSFEPAAYFEQPYTVVANLPYHITSPALRHLLGAGPPFAQRLVVMVQAEVAERITAQPGHMSALAVTIQAQARVKILRHVPAAAFYPPPKVDSAVMLLEPVDDQQRTIQRHELAAFATSVQAGFKQPRKTLGNSLADGLRVSKADATERLRKADIDPSKRPEALALDDWVRLFRANG